MLGRQAGKGVLRGLTVGRVIRPLGACSYSDKPAQESLLPDAFKEQWKRVAPNLDIPRFPPTYLPPRPPQAATIPTKLTVNFVLPTKVELRAKEVDMVMVPALTGQMGVLPGHVSTIAELKAGLLSIHNENEVTKYFVSSGFVFIHPNSVTDIVAIEAVPLDQIDPEEVKKGLADYTQKMNTASTDLEKAQAQIGLEVHSALSTALPS